MIEPLRDDCAERYSEFRRKWAKRCDNGRSLLVRTLKRQLALRPDIDCPGLWPDTEERKIAAFCARDFKESLGLPNDSLIPDDPLEMLMSIDYECFVDALTDLEREYRLALAECRLGIEMPTGEVGELKTFGDLVCHIHEHQGTLTCEETCRRDRLGWGCSVFLWLLFAGIIGTTIFMALETVEAVRNSTLGWSLILKLVFGSLLSVLAIVAIYANVVNWFKKRRTIRE